MKAFIDQASRKAKMRAHTATHLLHFLLYNTLGGTKQAGSLVDEDYLRFDFATKQALTEQQLQDIETTLNGYVYGAFPVDIQEMSYDEAIATGAKAFFEDKYGDTVRVVRIQDDRPHNKTDVFPTLQSIELCGGTHVPNTADIGAFKITEQTSVASGIRRIVAVTGPKVAEYAQQLENNQRQLANKLDCQPKQLAEKLDKTLKTYQQIKTDYEGLQTQLIGSHLTDLGKKLKNDHPEFPFNYLLNITDTPLTSFNFKDIVNQAKSQRNDKNRILYNETGNFAIFCSQENFSAKDFAKKHNLKGGGSDQLVQGRDTNIGKLFS